MVGGLSPFRLKSFVVIFLSHTLRQKNKTFLTVPRVGGGGGETIKGYLHYVAFIFKLRSSIHS